MWPCGHSSEHSPSTKKHLLPLLKKRTFQMSLKESHYLLNYQINSVAYADYDEMSLWFAVTVFVPQAVTHPGPLLAVGGLRLPSLSHTWPISPASLA